MSIDLICGDLFSELPKIEPDSIDLVIADLPYGQTMCTWDKRVNLDKLWIELWRVCKPKSVIVMFGSQPFSSMLVMSQLDHFKYEWIWEKSKASNFLDCKKRPLKSHESLLTFCRESNDYYPQMTYGKPYKSKPGNKVTDVYNSTKDHKFRNNNKGLRYPRSVQYFKTSESEGKPIHSTQKPVNLLEYLIKTYSKEGQLILDPCFGSGTTAIACKNTNRKFIGFEIDADMVRQAKERLNNQFNK